MVCLIGKGGRWHDGATRGLCISLVGRHNSHARALSSGGLVTQHHGIAITFRPKKGSSSLQPSDWNVDQVKPVDHKWHLHSPALCATPKAYDSNRVI